MAPSFATLSAAVLLSSAALLNPTPVDAHQVVLLPAPTYTTSNRDTQYAPLAFLENQGFKTQADFNAWRRSKYKTLRAFMDSKTYKVTTGADQTCGWTNAKAAPQPIPAKGAYRTSGYTHEGPCEVWLGNTRVYASDNCNVDQPGKDHVIDYTACGDSCTMYWYWLGNRYLKNAYSWQIYKACIPIASKRRLEEIAGNSTTIIEE